MSLEHAHCTVVIKADEPTAVHLPGSRHIAPVPEGRLDRVAEGSSLFFAFSYLLTPFFSGSCFARLVPMFRTVCPLTRLELGPFHNLDHWFSRRGSSAFQKVGAPWVVVCLASRWHVPPRSTFVFGASGFAWLRPLVSVFGSFSLALVSCS